MITNKIDKINIQIERVSNPASDTTRSAGSRVGLNARPLAERAPRMHWIEERSNEKDSLHLIQARVQL